MSLGVPPGSNVFNLTTWPEAVVFLAIMAVVVWTLYLVYLAARPFLEARAKCHKCPEEDEEVETVKVSAEEWDELTKPQ